MVHIFWYFLFITTGIICAAAPEIKPPLQATSPTSPVPSGTVTSASQQPALSLPSVATPAPEAKPSVPTPSLAQQPPVISSKTSTPSATMPPIAPVTTVSQKAQQAEKTIAIPPTTEVNKLSNTVATHPHTEPVVHEPSHPEHVASEHHELEHSSHHDANVASLPEHHQEPPVEKTLERTFAMIKPHVTASHKVGRIISLIEENKFTIVALKLHRLTKEEAEAFYAVHHDKPFFAPLVELMTSGPSVLMVLDRPHAISAWRELAGATDPEEARPGTIRAMYGESKQNNAVHGADSLVNAAREIALFFPELSASHHKAPSHEEDDAERVLNLADEFDEDDALTLTPSEIATQRQHEKKRADQPSYQA